MSGGRAMSARARRRSGAAGGLRNVGQGEPIRVNDRVINVYRRGSGDPAVVIEAGHLNVAFDWTDVVDRCSRTTFAFAYDRSGLGWSVGPVKGPRTPTRIARELKDLLRALGVRGRVVLVGHSLGGLYVRRFAELFPADVAGLVLVDPSHPDQRHRRAPSVDSLYRSLRRRHAMPELNTRESWTETITAHRPNLSRAAIEARVDAVFRPRSLTVAERQVAAAWARRGRVGSRSLPTVPLAVISAGRSDRYAHIPADVASDALAAQRGLHRELAQLVPGGRLIIAKRSGHLVMWDQPELIARIVTEMVQEERSTRRSSARLSRR